MTKHFYFNPRGKFANTLINKQINNQIFSNIFLAYPHKLEVLFQMHCLTNDDWHAGSHLLWLTVSTGLIKCQNTAKAQTDIVIYRVSQCACIFTATISTHQSILQLPVCTRWQKIVLQELCHIWCGLVTSCSWRGKMWVVVDFYTTSVALYFSPLNTLITSGK